MKLVIYPGEVRDVYLASVSNPIKLRIMAKVDDCNKTTLWVSEIPSLRNNANGVKVPIHLNLVDVSTIPKEIFYVGTLVDLLVLYNGDTFECFKVSLLDNSEFSKPESLETLKEIAGLAPFGHNGF